MNTNLHTIDFGDLHIDLNEFVNKDYFDVNNHLKIGFSSARLSYNAYEGLVWNEIENSPYLYDLFTELPTELPTEYEGGTITYVGNFNINSNGIKMDNDSEFIISYTKRDLGISELSWDGYIDSNEVDDLYFDCYCSEDGEIWGESIKLFKRISEKIDTYTLRGWLLSEKTKYIKIINKNGNIETCIKNICLKTDNSIHHTFSYVFKEGNWQLFTADVKDISRLELLIAQEKNDRILADNVLENKKLDKVTINDNKLYGTKLDGNLVMYAIGDNLLINNDIISAKDTTYLPGDNIDISTNNLISAKGYIFNEDKKSFSENSNNYAVGMYSHAEGSNNTASGNYSHVENGANIASHNYSHVEGGGNTSGDAYQHVGGKYNIEKTGAVIIGGGTSTTKKNIYELDWNGNPYFAGTTLKLGNTSITETLLKALLNLL